ncbi:MAG: sigma-70 family RNA polymerase sigma factor [Planctomycetota bacterium]|nr:sigma-70 family RNA polymerase sigma factor [Planctomycetota bacterium]
MAKNDPETLLERYATDGDVGALAQLFDGLAPDLTRLATQLVGDAHLAEDIVQETFLAVVERPEAYDRTRPLKPWLIGILVNRARTARRRAGRSPEPDRLVERVVATPDQELGHAETLAELDRALAELPDSLRTVVEARLAGEDPANLAERLGLSRGALRVRLHRGLQRVRGLLPASLATGFSIVFLHSSGLAQVRGLVLKRARERSLAKGLAATTTAVGLGGILMTKQVMLVGVVAALALVIGGSGLFGGGSEPQLEEPGTRTGPEPELVAAVVPDPGPSAAEAETQREAVVAPGAAPQPVAPSAPGVSLELRGEVLDDLDRAVSGATVKVWAKDEDRVAGGTPLQAVRTGAGGRFELAGLGARFVVFAEAPGLVPSEGLTGRDLEPGVVEDLVLRVQAGASQRGVVRDPAGSPVEGAEVWTSLNLGYEGSATDVDGLWLLGAGSLRVQTDALGRFSLADLPGRPTRLHAKKHPFLIHDEGLTPSSDELEIVLDAGYSKRGRVLAADGTPAAGARLRMWPFWSNRQTVDREVQTDEDGWFHLRALETRNQPPAVVGSDGLGLTVVHPGHAVEVVQPLVPDEAGGELLLIQLSPERVLAGVVVDGKGQPVEGARLRAEGSRLMNPGFVTTDPTTWEWSARVASTRTAADGSFRLGSLYAGEFELHVTDPEDGDLFTQFLVDAGEEDLRLVLDAKDAARSVIRGVVVDDVTGEPVPSFVVTPMIQSATGGVGSNFDFEGPTGRFEVAVPFGADVKVGVNVKAEGYVTLELPYQSFARGATELELRLSQARTLEVRVVDGAGELVSGGSLYVRNGSGELISLHQGGGLRSTGATLDGEVVPLLDLPAAPVQLGVHAPGFADQEVWLDLTVPHAGAFTFVLEEQPMGRLNAFVLCEVSGLDPNLMGAWLADLSDPENAKSLRAALADEQRVYLDADVEFSVTDEAGKLIAKGGIERDEDGRFRTTKEDLMSGGKGWSTTGARQTPELSLHLPTGRVRLELSSPGHRPYDVWLEIEEQTSGMPTFEMIYLVHR